MKIIGQLIQNNDEITLKFETESKYKPEISKALGDQIKETYLLNANNVREAKSLFKVGLKAAGLVEDEFSRGYKSTEIKLKNIQSYGAIKIITDSIYKRLDSEYRN